MIQDLSPLVVAIAEVGDNNELNPPVHEINAFRDFFNNGTLNTAQLDEHDGDCTRRELILRMLLLNAVLDQGPDIEGVRKMMVGVINSLYANEIRIFHTPLDFFEKINISIKQIQDKHEEVKRLRSVQWAADNQSSPSRYNLYMDNSKQTLNYAVFRWGVPLALPYLLSKEYPENSTACLLNYLKNHPSAENMSTQLKDNKQFGLGKAIGDKACHLFTKWIVSSFKLIQQENENNWSEYSYEVPYDSNAGRVLWRTGYLSYLANKEKYIRNKVIQPEAGQGGRDYIRVTNIRGMSVNINVPDEFKIIYRDICVNHLKSHKRSPQKIEIQRFQHPILFHMNKKISAFDDGLIEIGRNYCLNHDTPRCEECPIKEHCKGYNSDRSLIENYRT